MSCATGGASRTYSVLKNDLTTGFGVEVPLDALGTSGRITNVKLRLDPTRDGAQAVELFIGDADLSAQPDELKMVIHEEIIGLTGHATEVSYDRDFDKVYSVAAAGNMRLNLNFLAVDGVSQSTVYVEVTTEAF